jgi:hypothetical protein
MDKAVDVGKNVFNKYNQLFLQPNIIANPSVYTFTKGNMMFVVESGCAGLMGHSHELYEVRHEHKDAIISFKMAKTYIHEHDATYFIVKHCNSYIIRTIKNGVVNDKLINMSPEIILHAHSLKIREIFKDSVRIFSDYRDIQIISNNKYTFEIQIDEGVLIEHIHDIHQIIPIPKEKMYRNAEVAFVFKEQFFHGHDGVFYIEKEDDEFVIKFNRRIVNKTTPDNKTGKHEHNIKLIRVTKRTNNKNLLLEDPVPDHVASEVYNAARLLLQLT